MGLLAWIRKKRAGRRIAAAAAPRLPELPACSEVSPVERTPAAWSVGLVDAERLAARGDATGAAEALGREIRRLRAQAAITHALLATALAHLGRAEAARGKLSEARGAMREALEIWRASGDREGILAGLSNLVEIERRSGETAAASAHARELASECHQAGDDAGALRYGELARALVRPFANRQLP